MLSNVRPIKVVKGDPRAIVAFSPGAGCFADIMKSDTEKGDVDTNGACTSRLVQLRAKSTSHRCPAHLWPPGRGVAWVS
jgi:hypothetical protein